jgi:hypothetical protein
MYSVVRTYGGDLVLLGSDSYIHWVDYWFVARGLSMSLSICVYTLSRCALLL